METKFEVGKSYRTRGAQFEPVTYTVQARTNSQLVIKGPLGSAKRLNIDTVDCVELVRPISGAGVVLRADEVVP